MYATTNEANKVIINVTGKKNINLPIMPGQKSKGTKGARVVSVPESTGKNTSPAAAFAALTIGTLPF